MRVWYLVYDCGDGSSTVNFFRTVDAADKACDDSLPDWDEGYNGNEGAPSFFDVESSHLIGEDPFFKPAWGTNFFEEDGEDGTI